MPERTLRVVIAGDSRSLERSFASASRSAKGFSVGLGTLAKSAAVIGGLTAVVGGLSAAVRTGFGEFSDASKAAAQTAAAIKATGGVANVTAKQVDKLASSVLAYSGIDDEAVKAGENLLLTFKNVRNEIGKGNQVFDRATRAAVDLSVAGFGSIETTAKQLGKALNDPVRGMTALGRAGVTFTESQRKQIKALVETGRLLKAQKLILREVESQVGGSARALGDTLPGKLSKLRESLKNALGAVVSNVALALSDELVPAAEHASNAITAWISVTGNQRKISDAATGAARALADTARTLASVFRTLRDVLGPVVKSLGGVQSTMKALVAVAVAAKVASFTSAVFALGTTSATTARQVNLLRASMLRLGAIGLVTLGVEVVMNRRQIEQKVDTFLRGHGLGFLATRKIEIPVDANVSQLEEARRKVIALGDAGGFTAEALGKLIRRLRELQVQRSVGIKAASAIEGFRAGNAKAAADSGTGSFVDSIARAIDVAKAKAAAAIAAAEKASKAQAAAARKAAAAARKAAEQQRAAFDSLLGSLGLQVDRAAATRGFADDLKANSALQAAIKKQIAVEGNTTELATQLFQAQQARSQILAQQAQAAADARAKAAAKVQAAQFRALGLTAEGDKRTPGVPNLRRQLEQLTARLGPDVAPKIRSQLAAVGKVLSGSVGKVTEETRKKIVELFQTIRGTFDTEAGRGAGAGGFRKTGFQDFIAGITGLTASQVKALRSKFVQMGPGGTMPTPGFGAFGMAFPRTSPATVGAAGGGLTVNVNGNIVTPNPDAFLREMQRRAGVSAATRTGVRPGINRGLG